ncbi:MAG: hypothetical protein HY983_01340 [Candidatus Magasanikbacteria bacterium]|nr:hypothetical protein [Candidatus Magasanikbacteria bacterium]
MAPEKKKGEPKKGRGSTSAKEETLQQAADKILRDFDERQRGLVEKLHALEGEVARLQEAQDVKSRDLFLAVYRLYRVLESSVNFFDHTVTPAKDHGRVLLPSEIERFEADREQHIKQAKEKIIALQTWLDGAVTKPAIREILQAGGDKEMQTLADAETIVSKLVEELVGQYHTYQATLGGQPGGDIEAARLTLGIGESSVDDPETSAAWVAHQERVRAIIRALELIPGNRFADETIGQACNLVFTGKASSEQGQACLEALRHFTTKPPQKMFIEMDIPYTTDDLQALSANLVAAEQLLTTGILPAHGRFKDYETNEETTHLEKEYNDVGRHLANFRDKLSKHSLKDQLMERFGTRLAKYEILFLAIKDNAALAPDPASAPRVLRIIEGNLRRMEAEAETFITELDKADLNKST